MAQAKKTTSPLKMSMKVPLTGKRPLAKHQSSPVRRSSGILPLPPSLLKLPTAAFDTDDLPRNRLFDIDINDKSLDEWLMRLDEETKPAEKEQSTNDVINKAMSRVATDITTSRSASSFFDEEPPKKKRRFARRNSFIVRDISKLSGIAEKFVNSTSDL